MIEKLIQENTEALKALTEAVKAMGDKPVKKAKEETAKPAPTPAPVAEAPKPAPTPAPVAEAPKGIPYEEVKAAMFSLVDSHGQAAGVKILTDHGVKKGTELKPEQYPSVLKAIAAAKAPVAAAPEELF